MGASRRRRARSLPCLAPRANRGRRGPVGTLSRAKLAQAFRDTLPMHKFPRCSSALAVVGALIAFTLSASAAATSPTLERIKERGTIVFSYRHAAPPFSYRDREGRVKGYSVDLCLRVAALIQKELGLKELQIEWVSVEAATRLDAVATGKVDADCGTTTISLSRMEQVDFSVPIYVDGGGVLVR